MSWLSANKDPINTWIDTLSKLALMISLIVGGIWTYLIFIRKDAPALEFHAGLDTEIRWRESTNKDLCWGTVRAALKNEGIKPFTVTHVWLRGWYYNVAARLGTDETNPPPLPAGHADILNVQRIMSREPDIKKEFNVDNSVLPGGDILPGLLTRYPPGAEANQETEFIFKRDPMAGVLFKVDVKTGEDFRFIPSSFATDLGCGDVKQESKPTPAK